ncbi:MAG: type II toxin-antitoxin system VapC family toxin [Euryarchaeota archaeon]|nr:type II toxin-antitoxin system VapC family toxin [Euryarchaeota archaeon]
MICLDTTYFVDLIKNPDAIRDITQKIDEEGGAATTVLNVFEAYIGAFAVKDDKTRKKIKEKLDKAFNRVEILDFKYRDALKASEIGGTLLRSGREVGADAITAAVALNNGYSTVVTRNIKHFELIKEVIKIDIQRY